MLFKETSSGIVAAVGEHSTHLLKTKVPVIGVLFKVFFKITESGNTTHKNTYLRKNRFNLYYAYALKLLIGSENKKRFYQTNQKFLLTRKAKKQYSYCIKLDNTNVGKQQVTMVSEV